MSSKHYKLPFTKKDRLRKPNKNLFNSSSTEGNVMKETIFGS